MPATLKYIGLPCPQWLARQCRIWEDFFCGDVVKKLQVSLFCLLALSVCCRSPSLSPPAFLAIALRLRLLSPSEHCRLPSLLPPELLSLSFAIAARVTVAAYNADVREEFTDFKALKLAM